MNKKKKIDYEIGNKKILLQTEFFTNLYKFYMHF